MAFTYITGAGTQQNPYVITDVNGWEEFVRYTENNFMASEYVELGADIVFNDITNFDNWGTTPPQNETLPMWNSDGLIVVRSGFQGHFDGKNHKFVGVYIDSTAINYHYTHLFHIEGGTLQNLILDHAYIKFGITDPQSQGDYNEMGNVVYVTTNGSATEYYAAVKNLYLVNCYFKYIGNSLWASPVEAPSVEGIYVDDDTVIDLDTACYLTVNANYAKDVIFNGTLNLKRSFSDDGGNIAVFPVGGATHSDYYYFDTIIANWPSPDFYFKNCVGAGTINLKAPTVQGSPAFEYTFNVIHMTVPRADNIVYTTAINVEENALPTTTDLEFGYIGWSSPSFDPCDISNSYFASDVTIAAQSGTIRNLDIHPCTDSQTVTNCYNKGSLTIANGVTITNKQVYNIGSGSISNSYYIDGYTQNANDGTALTAVQFTDSTNFAGWDFQNTWEMGDDAPVLRNTPLTFTVPTANAEPGYTVTLTSSNGILGSVTGSGSYAAGSSVTIEAVPASVRSGFVQWSDGDTSNPRTITVNDNVTLSATFQQLYHLDVYSSSPAACGTVTGAGYYPAGTVVHVTAVPNAGYRLKYWNNLSGNLERDITMPNSDATAVAFFQSQVSITVGEGDTVTYSSMAGSLSRVENTYSGWFDPSGTSTITVTPAEGRTFHNWSDGNTSNPRTIQNAHPFIDTPNITVAEQRAVNLTSNNLILGTVSGSGNYYEGSSAVISATASPSAYFVGWNDGNTDNPRTLTIGNSDIELEAFFALYRYTVNIETEPEGVATITGAGTYDAGTVVTIEAIPEESYRFYQWSDGNTDNPRTFTVNQPINLTATFQEIINHTVTLLSNSATAGTLSGAGEYEQGTQATIAASPAPTFEFAGWSDGNTSSPRTLTVNSDITLTASFKAPLTVTLPDATDSVSVTGGDLAGLTSLGNNVYKGLYEPGSTVAMTITPGTKRIFVKWDANDANSSVVPTAIANMTQGRSYAPVLTNGYYVTLTTDSSMGLISCSPSIQAGELVPEDTVLTLTAGALNGYRFVQWNDGSTSVRKIFTVNDDVEYTAIFEEIPKHRVDLTVNDPTKGSVRGSGIYGEGSTIMIYADALPGYRFVTWDDGNANAARRLDIGETDVEIMAVFETVFKRETDLNRYRGRLGRIKSNGSIFSTITLNKNVTRALNFCAELGQFDTNTGRHFIFVSIKDPVNLTCKQYSLALNHNHTSNEWMKAEPIDESDITDTDYQFEVKADGVSAALRIKYIGDNLTGDIRSFQIILQNLGTEDENWIDGSGDGSTYMDDTEVPGMISSIPSGAAVFHDHLHLANRGDYTHAQIDQHINAPNPHEGHENKENKDQPEGYAGLDAEGKISSQALPDVAVTTDDPRLTNDRYPLQHAPSHQSGGDDELRLTSLAGSLPQSRSHDNVDVDSGSDALHHTLGNGPTQAAPGNHNHDALYAPITQGVTGGNNHNHDGETTAAIDHENLLNKGTNTHTQIDAHIAAQNPHAGHELRSNKDIANGYAGLNALGKLKSSEIEFGNLAGTVCQGNDPRLTDTRPPASHAIEHEEGGNDELTLANIKGNLTQIRTHSSPDTDTSASSIHHTLGNGVNQAAPGNHNHDSIYAPISILLADNNDIGPNLIVNNSADTYVLGTQAVTSNGTTTLKTRFHKFSHNDLSDTGTNSHSVIDAFIAASSQYEVTANRGQANGYASLDANGRIPLSQMPSSATALVPNVADIAARNALTNVADGAQYRVLDASSDPSVDNGWAIYTYVAATGVWVKTAEQESLDVITDWSNIQNKPVSTTVQLDNAVNISHIQGTDAELDAAGNNHVTAAEIRSHIDASAPHAGHELTSNKGVANGYAGLDANGKLPLAQLTDNIAAASAVEATHAINADHATTATSATTAGLATNAVNATNAVFADSLSSSFNLVMDGDVTGSVAINGTNDVVLNATVPGLNALRFALISDDDIKDILDTTNYDDTVATSYSSFLGGVLQISVGDQTVTFDGSNNASLDFDDVLATTSDVEGLFNSNNNNQGGNE